MAVSHADATHNKAKIEHHDYGRNFRLTETGRSGLQEHFGFTTEALTHPA